MNNIELKKTAKKLASAFNKGTFIAPLSTKFTKNSKIADELRKESEKLKSPTKIKNKINFASLRLGNFCASFNTISTISNK